MAMKMKMKIKKGFSLLELTLVLGVGTMVAFMKFQDMKNEQETIMANAVGQQMKQIGEAVNGYINIRYDKLSTLSNAAGTGTDPGPRTCSGSACEITYQTLINEGLLPSTYTGVNAQKSSYKIILKREGTSPNYVVNGLITTTLPWSEGTKIRYDLLGKAMLSAGVDSGMTKSATVASGYEGQWSEKTSDFRNITAEGLLAYRTGFNSAMYTVYLRRDGTLPMTGDLNMGGKNIGNAKNITASGTGDFDGDISSNGNITADKDINAGHWLSAKNGYGNKIMIGGDSTGGDYDFIFEPTVNNTVGFFSKGGATPFSFNFRGSINALNAQGSQRGVSINGTTGEITASGNIESSQNVKGATLESTGRATVGEFVQVNGTVSEGDSCSTNGLMGRTGNGTPMYCIDGYWTNIVSSKTKNGGMFLPGGMKMMWGTLSENLTDYGSLDGLSYFESKFKTYEPTFIANGKTYKFSNIFSVQFSPVDVGGAAMERMWGTPYSGSFSYAFSSAIKTTMTGTYLAIGY